MMMPALLAMLSVAASTNIALLPLAPGDGVSKKQARGIDALTRQAIADTGFLELIKKRRDDVRTQKKCLGHKKTIKAVDLDCLSSAAYARSVDLIGLGVLNKSDEGFSLDVVVAKSGDAVAVRQIAVPLAGDHLIDDLQIGVRRIFAPKSVAGGLFVTGAAGTRVLVDDKDAGQLPMDAIDGLVEGPHVVRAEREGYIPQIHNITVHFREMSTLELVLTKEHGAAGDVVEEKPLSPLVIAGSTIAGAGGVALVGGTLTGMLSFLAKREVDARANAKLLSFPRDASLVRRGQLLTYTADALFIAGLVAVLGGGAVAGLAYLPEDQEEAEQLAPAAQGAPTADELVPALEGL